MNLESLEKKLAAAASPDAKSAETKPPAENLPKITKELIKKAGQLTIGDYYSHQLSQLELILLKHGGTAASENSWERTNAPINLKKMKFKDITGSLAAAIMRVNLYIGGEQPIHYYRISYNFIPDQKPEDKTYLLTEEFKPGRLVSGEIPQNSAMLYETLQMLEPAVQDAELNPHLVQAFTQK